MPPRRAESPAQTTCAAEAAQEDGFRLLVESVKDYAIFKLDTGGRIATWNVGAERIKGYNADEIIGKHFSIFYPPEDVAAGKTERELEIATREGRFEEEGWRIKKDGSRMWASVTITALRNAHGDLVGFAKVTRDLTDRRAADEETRRFRLLVESVKDYAIFMLDTGGHVATWNPGAERIKGYRPDEIIGKHFSIFYPPEDIAAGKTERELDRRSQQDTRSSRRAGLGLGLYISKEVTLAHGGDITVRSTMTEGTTFQVTLPAEPQMSPKDTPP